MQLKQQYINSLLGVEKKSELTVNDYVKHTEAFEDWLKNNSQCSLLEVNEDIVYCFIEYCTLELKNEPTTVNKKIAALKKYYEFLQRKKKVSENPVSNIPKQKKNVKPPVFLSEKEVRKILRAIKTDRRRGVTEKDRLRDYAMIKILVSTGLRATELANLKIKDIDFKKSKLQVVSGKGNKDRIVPLGESTLQSIIDYLQTRQTIDDNEFVFINKKSNQYNHGAINKRVKTYVGLAGLDTNKIHTHTLRHTCATMTYANSRDVVAVQALLGHSSLDMTSKYVHLVEENVRNAVMTNKFA